MLSLVLWLLSLGISNINTFLGLLVFIKFPQTVLAALESTIYSCGLYKLPFDQILLAFYDI